MNHVIQEERDEKENTPKRMVIIMFEVLLYSYVWEERLGVWLTRVYLILYSSKAMSESTIYKNPWITERKLMMVGIYKEEKEEGYVCTKEQCV